MTEREFLGLMRGAGFSLHLASDHTRLHADTAGRLLAAIRSHRDEIVAQAGSHRYDDLVAAHTRWVERLTTGRVRKLALVIERPAQARPARGRPCTASPSQPGVRQVHSMLHAEVRKVETAGCAA